MGWEGSYEADLRAMVAEDPTLAGRVHFTGHQDDVYAWMDALDIVVHASFGEPFGLVLVEAMALGKPLVATAAGGPTEIIEHGVSGLLVPPGDSVSLADAIGRILNEPGLASSLSVGARRRADLFTEEAMAEGIAKVLNRVARDLQ